MPLLARASLGTLFLELATPRAGELEVLASLPSHKRIGVGVIDQKADRIETVDAGDPPDGGVPARSPSTRSDLEVPDDVSAIAAISLEPAWRDVTGEMDLPTRALEFGEDHAAGHEAAERDLV